MNKKKINRSLKKIADKYGVSVDEVRRDIKIAASMAKENPDEKIQAFWDSIPSEGDTPTPEEVIAHVADIAKNKKQ